MAKLTGRGFEPVARAGFALRADAADTYPGTVVLRSDGRILRRFTGDTATGYTIHGKVRPGVPLTPETLEKIVRTRGWVLTSPATKV